MEKVRLTIEDLQVQSFATSQADAERGGTVHAHDAPTDRYECPTQDYAWGTCGGSCPENSCGCETSECTVDDCWFTDWGPCTWNGGGNPSDC
jgi:hypothetical protein